jgi:hypothetical protein
MHYKSKPLEVSRRFDKKQLTERKTTPDKGGDVYLASINTQSDQDIWLIDSGESYHVTSHKEWFCEYEQYEGRYVFLGDDSTTKIFRQGRVRLILQDGRRRTLSGVIHIPVLEKNLISISKMSDAGVHTLFLKDSRKMVIGVMVLMKGVHIGSLYMLLGSVESAGCNNIIVPEVDSTRLDLTQAELIQIDSRSHHKVNLTMLWQERMGHIGEKGLRAMHNKGMVEDFPKCNLEVDFCEHCIYGKQSRVRFRSRSTSATRILKLVHSGVFGPYSVPSLGGSMYYVSFIDCFSKKVWIYLLRKKVEVFEKFKEFKFLVENQRNKKIKVLRTDNDGELCENEFDQF